MRTGTVKALLLAACLLNVGANALAETSTEPVVRNGVAYITGGIGQDEVAAFRDVASRYNLRITFASNAGQYLADIDVTLSSGKSKLLDVHTSGPFLFARVPPGRYTVSAHDRAVQEVRRVVVPARGAVDVRFYWHDPDRRGTMRLCMACPASQPQADR
ncbi:carboxypeptidase regulatory-like domain-containing protein [Burkholderia cenocepacia]|uniref:carboxypeptidase regulatory-like domain-containing protein n=1 Tax=Burkholderia cenocepacia TaxID=95486 RepID=UPI00196B7107|nr:carboxypeptidase regulatory-like domain-containing protein [Burkholderia cenocepacia]MBN3503193.1 carboxypeptidase regulatory-like domain-containing protein [Burkholderia cenocepacia]MCO1394300.1 carboxypeptidase regulatory-like domain-containing protein [Burkholderia cenocepacia]MCO1404884.1 carboxypeptidase regulatory-like domain-containing protein [Burkholderia cenocepacia]UQN96405.1 carboxypeptidase regulatory-like domain-containing protein [Burkholderia cenocepacia]UQO02628.1 carboxype